MPNIGDLAKGKNIGKKAGYTYIYLACPVCGYKRWVKYVHAQTKNFNVLCKINGCQQRDRANKYHATNPLYWDGISPLKIGMQRMSGKLADFKSKYYNQILVWDECYKCHKKFWRIPRCTGRLCDHCKRVQVAKTALYPAGRKAWANPIKREQWIKNSVKGVVLKPTIIEQIIINVIQEYNLPYKYVGDGEVIIEGKNPDFINTNSQKIIIEVYGQYWHKPEDQPERIKYFAKYGYKTLILWDTEILKRPHDEIYQKIKTFTDKCLADSHT
jgi:DNA-directed RNA polymerase subunit RPC12/RpoP